LHCATGHPSLFKPDTIAEKIMRRSIHYPMLGALVFLALGLSATGQVGAADNEVRVLKETAVLGATARADAPRREGDLLGDRGGLPLRTVADTEVEQARARKATCKAMCYKTWMDCDERGARMSPEQGQYQYRQECGAWRTSCESKCAALN
jgi:hypothetical protein